VGRTEHSTCSAKHWSLAAQTSRINSSSVSGALDLLSLTGCDARSEGCWWTEVSDSTGVWRGRLKYGVSDEDSKEDGFVVAGDGVVVAGAVVMVAGPASWSLGPASWSLEPASWSLGPRVEVRRTWWT